MVDNDKILNSHTAITRYTHTHTRAHNYALTLHNIFSITLHDTCRVLINLGHPQDGKCVPNNLSPDNLYIAQFVPGLFVQVDSSSHPKNSPGTKCPRYKLSEDKVSGTNSPGTNCPRSPPPPRTD